VVCFGYGLLAFRELEPMTMNDILVSAPVVLGELTRELVRRGEEEYRKNPQSQVMACLSLAIRSASLLCGIGKLLTPQTRDSAEVLLRGFLESRDLLMTFRFDQKGARDKIAYWFEGNVGASWKAERKKNEEFLEKLGHSGTEFAQNWSKITTLAHPTRFAADNSVACVTLWAASPPRQEDLYTAMGPKIADYLTSIATLIVIATIDFPGFISLGCDLNRMPNIDSFRDNVSSVVAPILNEKKDGELPPGSFRRS
jgi:hypothetical protein